MPVPNSQWTIFGLGTAFLVGTWFWSRPTGGAGTEVEKPITLITSDAYELACASPHAVGAYRCAYEAPGKPFQPPPAPELTLAPYKDTTGSLLLVAGLFRQPELQRRLAEENPAEHDRDTLRRFTARCRVKALERVDNFYIQWVTSAGFDGGQNSAWAFAPSSCVIE